MTTLVSIQQIDWLTTFAKLPESNIRDFDKASHQRNLPGFATLTNTRHVYIGFLVELRRDEFEELLALDGPNLAWISCEVRIWTNNVKEFIDFLGHKTRNPEIQEVLNEIYSILCRLGFESVLKAKYKIQPIQGGTYRLENL